MSTLCMGDAQLTRLQAAATGCGDLPQLRDVDTIDDATAVAALAPGSRFARAVAAAEALAS